MSAKIIRTSPLSKLLRRAKIIYILRKMALPILSAIIGGFIATALMSMMMILKGTLMNYSTTGKWIEKK